MNGKANQKGGQHNDKKGGLCINKALALKGGGGNMELNRNKDLGSLSSVCRHHSPNYEHLRE